MIQRHLEELPPWLGFRTSPTKSSNFQGTFEIWQPWWQRVTATVHGFNKSTQFSSGVHADSQEHKLVRFLFQNEWRHFLLTHRIIIVSKSKANFSIHVPFPGSFNCSWAAHNWKYKLLEEVFSSFPNSRQWWHQWALLYPALFGTHLLQR